MTRASVAARVKEAMTSGNAPVGCTGGSARFATASEMAAFRDDPADGALIFGEPWDLWMPGFARRFRDRAVSIKDDRPILILAPTRCGKGRTQIVRNTLSYPGSIVSIDPKGEGALITAQKKLERGHAVYLLDPFGICAKLRGGVPMGVESSFDPLSLIDVNDPSAGDDLVALVECMVLEDDEYWAPITKAFIAGMFARFKLNPDPWPVAFIFQLMALPDDQFVGWLDRLGHGISDDNPLGAMFLESRKLYLEQEKKGRGILYRCVMNALRIFSGPGLRDVMAGSDLRFEDVQRRPTAVYLVLPTDKLVSHAAWLRLMVFCAMTGMARGPEPRHQTLVILDEFANLGYMEQIESAVSYASGLGMKLMIVVQDVGQIKKHYGEIYQTFFANAGATVVLGANDNATRKEISDLLGSTKMIKRQKEILQSDSDRLTETSVPLFTPDEVGRFCTRDTGGALVLVQGKFPMKIRALNYDDVLRAGIDYAVHPKFSGAAVHAIASSSGRPANNRRDRPHSAAAQAKANHPVRRGEGPERVPDLREGRLPVGHQPKAGRRSRRPARA